MALFYDYGPGGQNVTLGTQTLTWDGGTNLSAYGSITGTAGSTSFVKPAGWGHAGWCMIHQSQGTGVGNWEINWLNFGTQVARYPLSFTYGTGAQVITLSNGYLGYNNLTINGIVSVPAWNGTTGGIAALLCQGTFTVNNGCSLTADGATGVTQSITGAGNTAQTSGGGFRGGYGQQTTGAYQGQQGEGATQNGGASYSANGIGGGGAYGSGGAGSSAGGGGGHSASGAAGTSPENTNGAGGGTGGSADLASMFFGGGGGGSGSRDSVAQTIAAGGSGGGAILVIAKTITINTGGYILARGGAGGNGSRYADGGGGAGGSIRLYCRSASLGTSQVLATGGAGGSTVGGAGGTGRTRIVYYLSYTGTADPGLSAAQTNDARGPLSFTGMI